MDKHGFRKTFILSGKLLLPDMGPLGKNCDHTPGEAAAHSWQRRQAPGVHLEPTQCPGETPQTAPAERTLA